MLFKSRFHAGLRSGAIDRSYRRWKTPKVKVGGTYRFAPGDAIEVTSLGAVRAAQLTESAARRAGFDSTGALRREIERSGREVLGDGDELTEVRFRYVRAPAPQAPAEDVSATEAAAMRARIDGMEKRSRSGAWVWRTLELIAENPRRRAADLAEILGAELQPFKARVRRLKGLGLTTSFEVGYEVTPLARAALACHRSNE